MIPAPALCEFDVFGVPAPQGSKSAVVVAGRARIVEGKSTEQRRRHKSWRNAVAERAHDETLHMAGPLDGPLRLEVRFRLPMPASRPKAPRMLGVAWHRSQPDLSKLLRSTEDALTDAGLIRDDARICEIVASKIEVVGWTGAHIRLTWPDDRSLLDPRPVALT